MALSKKPVTGMRDILPAEMQVRDYVIGVIKETYAKFGFTSIETPCVEHIENLTNKQGGENEKLIFRILKRGEKLAAALKCGSGQMGKEQDGAQTNDAPRDGAAFAADFDLADGGLRYDLTVPLVRYYSNHANELPSPFKALQIGNVWRADRPQKGRYRQFMQCDIDILGEPTNWAEIELILATTTTLGKLGFRGFQIRINDRRILKAMAAYSGFPEDTYDQVFIILDKMDKIGADGVASELVESGFSKESAERYMALFEGLKQAPDGIAYLTETLGGFMESEVAGNLTEIIAGVGATKCSDFELVFDPTLVRGMSYYTGTIFEIAMPELGISCGGGGRYDKMVGKFTGNDVPACGFSIGFERIILILTEKGFTVPNLKKEAYLIEKGLPTERLCEVIAQAQKQRESGVQVLVARMNKNKKFQKEQLAEQGYTQIQEFYTNPLQ